MAKTKINTRITTDLEDPRLLRLLKYEAQETHTSIKSVVIKALEAYFFHKLELKALQLASEKTFAEWDNHLDSQYDEL